MPDISTRQGARERIESWLGRRRESALLVAIVAVLAGAGLLLWSRGAPAMVAPPAVAVSPAGAAAPTVSTGTPAAVPAPTQTSAPDVYVHVAGAVKHPGLLRLPSGARVADALKAAGGPLRAADVGALNLAAPVADGSKIEVVRRGRASPTAPLSSAPTAPLPSGPAPAPASSPTIGVISLNSADQAQLEAIPGVGPVTAQAILAFRGEIGSFTSVDQLLDVDGIGPATLEEIRPYVTP